MTRQDAIAQILACLDAAAAPAVPDVAEPAKPDKKKSAARQRGAERSSSPGAAPDSDSPAASRARAARSPTTGFLASDSAPSHTGEARDNEESGQGGDDAGPDEAAAEERRRAGELKREILNGELARLPLTDLGNAERFRRRFGDRFKWSATHGWFYWDGKRWSRENADAHVRIAAHETVRAIQDEAKALRARADRLAAEFEPPELGKVEKDFKKKHKTLKERHAARLQLVHDAGDPAVAEAAKKKRKAKEDADRRGKRALKALFMRWDAAALAAWGEESEMNAKMTPIDKHAAPYLAVSIEALDADPWMINVNNGTLVVDRDAPGMIRFKPHDPADLITKISPVDYDPRAGCPVFDGFLERIQPDEDNRRFVVDWLGYSLTGDATEQQLVVFHGAGGNGKGVLVRIATHIAGDYAHATPIETFLAEGAPRNASAPTPERAALPGVRMLTASEPQKGAKFDEGFIKMATGGDKISARDLNKSQFEFVPVFKLTISANHDPRVRDTTEGIWRRMNKIPFAVVIPRGEWDLKLDDKLKAEASGVLNVLLDGLRRWLVNGLVRSKVSEAATRQYREDSDPLGRFLADCTEAAPDAKVQSTLLHELYVAWARATGAPEWKHAGFTNAMKERGFETKKVSVMFFMGVRAIKRVNDFVDHLGKPLLDGGGAPARDSPGEDDVVI